MKDFKKEDQISGIQELLGRGMIFRKKVKRSKGWERKRERVINIIYITYMHTIYISIYIYIISIIHLHVPPVRFTTFIL